MAARRAAPRPLPGRGGLPGPTAPTGGPPQEPHPGGPFIKGATREPPKPRKGGMKRTLLFPPLVGGGRRPPRGSPSRGVRRSEITRCSRSLWSSRRTGPLRVEVRGVFN
eukprot:1894158-Pyramimonas_sp.AAC.1